MPEETVSLEFLARPVQRVLEEQREFHAEMRDFRIEMRSMRADMTGFREELGLQTSMIIRLDRQRLQRDEADAGSRDHLRARLEEIDQRLRALEDRE